MRVKLPVGRHSQFHSVIDTEQVESITNQGKKVTSVRMKSGNSFQTETSYEDIAELLGWDETPTVQEELEKKRKE